MRETLPWHHIGPTGVGPQDLSGIHSVPGGTLTRVLAPGTIVTGSLRDHDDITLQYSELRGSDETQECRSARVYVGRSNDDRGPLNAVICCADITRQRCRNNVRNGWMQRCNLLHRQRHGCNNGENEWETDSVWPDQTGGTCARLGVVPNRSGLSDQFLNQYCVVCDSASRRSGQRRCLQSLVEEKESREHSLGRLQRWTPCYVRMELSHRNGESRVHPASSVGRALDSQSHLEPRDSKQR